MITRTIHRLAYNREVDCLALSWHRFADGKRGPDTFTAHYQEMGKNFGSPELWAAAISTLLAQAESLVTGYEGAAWSAYRVSGIYVDSVQIEWGKWASSYDANPNYGIAVHYSRLREAVKLPSQAGGTLLLEILGGQDEDAETPYYCRVNVNKNVITDAKQIAAIAQAVRTILQGAGKLADYLDEQIGW